MLSIARNVRVPGVARYKSPRWPIFLHGMIRINAHANSPMRLFSAPAARIRESTRAYARATRTRREINESQSETIHPPDRLPILRDYPARVPRFASF